MWMIETVLFCEECSPTKEKSNKYSKAIINKLINQSTFQHTNEIKESSMSYIKSSIAGIEDFRGKRSVYQEVATTGYSLEKLTTKDKDVEGN